MSKLNRAWHEAHPMPPNPTLDQRIAWHLDHSAHCGCRPIPRLILEELARRGIEPPAPAA
ncbi:MULTISPECIES: hypothetical protein [Kaistia]|uniref:Uncharacterized protein n=1 Tax=Kaistia nematophila TaxID=2994654 RepID=A0A9X3INT3_9HYPH|nr:hypothetical protein [Kaistia nematophila]MBN9058908.1 hypothetical protein [Hyphomicrobiales bacterium]MCX5572282.1 hypothetical protein [Kaistia nematophila]